jgi:hypothetical protein
MAETDTQNKVENDGLSGDVFDPEQRCNHCKQERGDLCKSLLEDTLETIMWDNRFTMTLSF